MRIEYILDAEEAEIALYTIATSEDKSLGTDTETTGLDPHTSDMRLCQIANNGIAYLFDVFAISKKTFQRIFTNFLKMVKGRKIFIFHNFKFDVKMFWSHGIDFTGQLVFDTMLAVKVIECGLSLSASLKEVMERYLNIPMDKSEQKSDWGVKELSSSQLGYAATDVLKLKALAHELQQDLKAGNLMETFKLEMRAVYGFAMMEYYGIKLNLERLKLVRPYYEDNLSQARHKFLSRVPLRYVRKNLLGQITDEGIEPTSSTQVLEVLRELGIPNPFYNPTSKDEKEQDPIIPSTGSPLLKMVEVNDFPIVEALLDHRKASKILSSYIYNLPELVNTKTGRLHTDFNQIISTGRSCLAKGTQVTTVGGYKNIEDIEVGDLVYTYTNEGKLTIRKVLNVWNKGVRPTVKVKWQSSGNGSTGELICTPDHLFKTKYKGWVEAQNLDRYDKIYHLARREYVVDGNLRPRLYGTHSFMQLEQSVIKSEYFQASANSHIHHIDGNSSNNLLSNLAILSKEDHARLHAKELVDKGRISYQSLQDWYESGNKLPVLYGKDSPNYKHISRFALLKLLAKYKGRISYIPGDFATYKKKCKEHGIDYVAISQRYTSAGVYLSKGLLKESLDQKTKFCKEYKVDMRKYHRLCDYYGLETNHAITSVTEHVPLEVWDIEVEETNNFIANELCVHNSSTNPNLNQLPRPSGKEPLDALGKPLSIRSCFEAEEGYVFALADFCLPAGTRVATERGLVPIDLVTTKDNVYQDNHERKQVLDVISKGKLPIYELKTKMGYTLRGTLQHRIRALVNNDYVWQELAQLKTGSIVALAAGRGFVDIDNYERLPDLTYLHRNNKQVTVPKFATEDFAEFLGYMTGDGSYSTYSLKWVVNDKDRDVFDKLELFAKTNFGYLGAERHYKGVFETCLNSTALLSWLRLLGSSKEYIPSFLYRSPATVVSAYLRGLFESDGSIGDRVSLTTTSKVLMEEVHQLLLSLGIVSVLKPIKWGVLTRKQAYCITIPALFTETFAETIGFMSVRKQSKLQSLLDKTNKSPSYGSIPLSASFIKSANPSGHTYNLLRNSIVLHRPISFNTAYRVAEENRELADKLGLLRTTEDWIYYDKVESITYYGEEECFDLSVADRQTYISEGFVSHNSQIELRVMASVCGDENMLEEFRQQKDPYSSTAAFLSRTPYEELVTINPHGEDKVKPEYKKLRQNAKAVRLGLNYGMWWKKLRNYARQQYGVHMTQEAAKANYDTYFEAYPGLKAYHHTFSDPNVCEARTLPPFNRRRLWDVYPGVPSMCNLPIQGTSGDIQKLAIANIYEELHGDGFSPTQSTDVRLVLTVHDELEIEATEQYGEYARELLQRNMVQAGEFVIKDCPILADAAIVHNLAEKD